MKKKQPLSQEEIDSKVEKAGKVFDKLWDKAKKSNPLLWEKIKKTYDIDSDDLDITIRL